MRIDEETRTVSSHISLSPGVYAWVVGQTMFGLQPHLWGFRLSLAPDVAEADQKTR
jgi:hypothetical protein